MIIVILLLIAGIYIATFWTRNNKPGEKPMRRLRQIHFGLLALLIILGILSNYNIYLRGYWTTKILIWLYILSAMVLFGLGQKGFQGKIERIYYGIFFYFPFVAIPLLFIPFLGTGIVLAVFGSTIGTNNDILYSDKSYRIQDTFHGLLAPATVPDLFVKRGLLEYKEKPLDMEYLYHLDSIRIENRSAKEITILFYNGDELTDNYEPLKVNVALEH